MEYLHYLPVIVLAVIGLVSGIATVLIAKLFGPKRIQSLKYGPYECGLIPVETARRHLSVKYYLVAILFILFDVETIYLLVWGVVYRDMLSASNEAALFMLANLFLFIGLLTLGLFYEIRKKVLEWNR